MEFPPELVRLIRAYSQPRFQHFREYNRILSLTALSEWPDLKTALQERPDEVLPHLLAYEKAQLEWLQVAGKPRTLYAREYDYNLTPDQWYTCKLMIRTREWTEFTKSLVG